MKTDRNSIKAGLFIVVAMALAVGVIISIKGIGRVFEPMQERQITFALADDLGGLGLGDDVRVGGYKVGRVKDIEVVTEGEAEPRLVVTIAVPERYVLREGARVGIGGTVTGSSWINFESLGAGAPVAEGVALAGRPSGISQVLAALSEAAPGVQGLIADVRTQTVPRVNSAVDRIGLAADEGKGLLADARAEVKPAVAKYHLVAERTTEMMTNVRDIAGDSKSDIRGTFANLNQATGTIKDRLPTTVDKVDAVLTKLETGTDQALAALTDVQATLKNTRDLSASARSMVAGNRGKIDAMVASLKTTGDNLKFASAEIRRSPWRLLYKPAKGEMANLNLYDAARQFAEGANDLNDAAISLRDAAEDPDADPATLQALVERMEKTFGEFEAVEAKLWEAVRP